MGLADESILREEKTVDDDGDVTEESFVTLLADNYADLEHAAVAESKGNASEEDLNAILIRQLQAQEDLEEEHRRQVAAQAAQKPASAARTASVAAAAAAAEEPEETPAERRRRRLLEVRALFLPMYAKCVKQRASSGVWNWLSGMVKGSSSSSSAAGSGNAPTRSSKK